MDGNRAAQTFGPHQGIAGILYPTGNPLLHLPSSRSHAIYRAPKPVAERVNGVETHLFTSLASNWV
jgi:hypothetical protein